ncbi:MAG: pyruvate formate-lyase-activating protein [Synergistaceae bacterium]|nr:pyruvate formate-lyase-activating protein [Synergistaceae bacterium]
MKKGNIHSIETCGTVDGPGIRFVVFLQGCPMRCLYCHNPDTWTFEQNSPMTSEEILARFDSLKEFFSHGGITVTGGEPMAQIEFVTELFAKANARNIHTALDTSGVYFDRNNLAPIDKLLSVTNLVLLDIKHIDNLEHKKLTGHENKNILDFARYLSEKNIPVWIRHVIVPGITDKREELERLGQFLKNLKNINALEILSYHNMAISKYEKLGIGYPLRDTTNTTKEEAIKARDIILEAMR